MNITALEAYLVEEPAPAHGWREGLPVSPATSDSLWIRVVTEDGLDGWSNLAFWGTVGLDLIDRRLRDLFVGQDALLKEDLWHRVWELDRIEELPIYLLGAVDVALWDLTAKYAGLPLYQVLGGARTSVPCYASTATFASIEEFLEVVDQCLELGFTAIKLHAWGDVRKDGELCTRLREHVGDDVDLLYDGSAAFDPYEALALGRVLEDASYAWYEEPMREFQIDAYVRLADALDIPILAGETSDGVHHTAAELLRLGAADMVRTGWYFKGGITGSIRISHLADSFGRTAEVHGGDLPNLHLCCAIRNTTWYESMALTNPVVKEAGIDDQGLIHAPTAPGIGWDVDLEALAAHAVRISR